MPDIPGATGPSYTPTSADVGKQLRYRERAIGPGGTSAWVYSEWSQAVVASGTTAPPVAANGLKQILYMGTGNQNAVTDGEASIRANWTYINGGIAPSWYAPAYAADGTVTMQEQSTAVEDLELIADAHAQGVPTWGVLANYYPTSSPSANDWDWLPVRTVLNDANLRSALVSNIVGLCLQKNFSGIDIDFEHPNRLGATNDTSDANLVADRAVFTLFVQALATALHAENRKLAITWPGQQSFAKEQTRPWDHYEIGKVADQCRLMIYDDYGYVDGPVQPFPPARLTWWDGVAAFTAGQIPSHRIVFGAANYGYIWNKPTGTAWTSSQVINNVVDTVYTELQTTFASVTETISTENGMKKAEWTTGGTDYLAYYEDDTTLPLKAAIVKKYNGAGIHYWRAGHEDPDIYSAVATTLNAATGSYSMDIDPLADTTIDAGGQTQDRSLNASLHVKIVAERRAILKFIIPELPAGATMTSATLSLRKNGILTNDSVGRTYVVNRMTQDDWARTGTTGTVGATIGVNWTKYDIARNLSWAAAGGDFTATDAATATVPATSSTMTWTVTNLVTWARNNGNLLSVLIKDQDTSGSTGIGATFDSLDHGTPANRPKLTINYTVA